jgi:putative tricarboxylic transport membrane protein
MKKTGDLISASIFILLGIGILIGAFRLGVGSATAPQPGFIPFLSGVALIGLSTVLLYQALRGQSKGSRTIEDLRRPATLIAGLVFYVGILETAGYIIATAAISAIVLWIEQTRSWWVLVTVSLGLATGTYLFFDRLLGVTFPVGILKGVL